MKFPVSPETKVVIEYRQEKRKLKREIAGTEASGRSELQQRKEAGGSTETCQKGTESTFEKQ